MPYTRDELEELLSLAEHGIAALLDYQAAVLRPAPSRPVMSPVSAGGVVRLAEFVWPPPMRTRPGRSPEIVGPAGHRLSCPARRGCPTSRRPETRFSERPAEGLDLVPLAGATGTRGVADDTGLEVEDLGGAPGVYSARYAGEEATYADNVAKLLAALAGVDGPRRARFRTVAVASWPDGREVVAEGAVEGAIALEARGEGGFGYDPVFIPDEGDGRTFAQMTAEEKHRLSHRGRAFRALADRLHLAEV